MQICNPRKAYLELIGAQKQFDINQLKERLAMRMMSKVEPAIARAMREKSLTYDRLSEHKDEIAQSVLPELSKMFEEDYGLKMFSFTLASVMIADEYVKAIETAKREKREREEEEAISARKRSRRKRATIKTGKRKNSCANLKRTITKNISKCARPSAGSRKAARGARAGSAPTAATRTRRGINSVPAAANR